MTYQAGILHEEQFGGKDGQSITVKLYNPGWGIKIDRDDIKSFKPIVAKLPQGTRRLYMPKPTKCNAKIVVQKDFWRNDLVDSVRVYQDVDADGCIVFRDSAFAVTSADCHTVVAYGNDSAGKLHVIAAHAGRDSLVKGSDIMTMSSNSVVANIVAKLAEAGVSAVDMHMRVYCGIRTGFTHPLDHPRFAKKNKILLQYAGTYEGVVLNSETCEIDLYALIRGQAMDCDVPYDNIVFDDIDTGRDDRWASKNREPDSDKRNLVIVSHMS